MFPMRRPAEWLGGDRTAHDLAWPKILASRLVRDNCPPAETLPGDVRHELAALATRQVSGATPLANPP
jgi:hypothetical protein